MTHFIAWIAAGLIAGLIANKIVNKSGDGLVLDIVLGIFGGLLGGWLASFFGVDVTQGLNIPSVLVAIVGAVVILLASHAVRAAFE
jgi:uncharacterized membrane protein YeaQ/YmgE (transglycosylase-associated protein family)